MRTFTKDEIEKYYEYIVHLVGDEESIAGKCTTCGRELNAVDLPTGLEKKIGIKQLRFITRQNLYRHKLLSND